MCSLSEIVKKVLKTGQPVIVTDEEAKQFHEKFKEEMAPLADMYRKKHRLMRCQ